MKRPYLVIVAAALITFAVGCGLVELQRLAQLGLQQAVQFILNSNNDIIGTGFVMEGRLVTAKHVAVFLPEGTPIIDIGVDTSDIGEAPIRGYERCRHQHKSGDKVRIQLGPWPGVDSGVPAMLNGPSGVEGMWDLFVDRTLWMGVSGSPVVCAEHNAVVATMSAFSPNAGWMIVSMLAPEHP